jgi:RNA 3'-terminal phosphate cyclase (ATP)
VEAAARLSGATVHGAEVGSQYLTFAPGEPTRERELEFDIGTAGSTTLVVQTVIVPAIALGVALRLRVRGGTHNPMAPPFEFLARVFVPRLRAMGAEVALTLERHGFAGDPGGGDRRAFYDRAVSDRGAIVLEVAPSGPLRAIELVEAAPISGRHACALLSRLPTHVAERELAVVRKQLGFAASECETRVVDAGAIGNALLLEIERDGATAELVTVHGEKGLRAEVVAQRACDELARYLAADVPVGEHLADQLLLPMAVAGAGRFRTLPLSSHALTNIATIQQLIDVPIACDQGIVAIG